MTLFSKTLLLPVLAAALVFCGTATSHAQSWWFGYWGSYRPTYYSSYYSPWYSSYTPTYTSYYTPTYYTASYVPSTTNYLTSYGCSTCCSSGNCGLQTSYSLTSCCASPCNSCVSCSNCSLGCDNCASGDCNLASSSSSTSSGTPTTVKPKADTGDSRNKTFLEERDSGSGSGYESPRGSGTGDGFSPRSNDPLDSPFGTSKVGGQETLRFKVPTEMINTREHAPTHLEQLDFETPRSNNQNLPEYPLLKLDEKITSRSLPQRTRLVERQTWQPTAIASNVTRQKPELNPGWVPVPAPTQLVQK